MAAQLGLVPEFMLVMALMTLCALVFPRIESYRRRARRRRALERTEARHTAAKVAP